MADYPDFTYRGNIDIIAQTLANLSIDIAAQTLTTLGINITAQDLAELIIKINAQTVSVQGFADWGVEEGNDKTLSGTVDIADTAAWTDIISYTVTAGKTLRIYSLGVSQVNETRLVKYRLLIAATQVWYSEPIGYSKEYIFSVPQGGAAAEVVKLQGRNPVDGVTEITGFLYCVEA